MKRFGRWLVTSDPYPINMWESLPGFLKIGCLLGIVAIFAPAVALAIKLSIRAITG